MTLAHEIARAVLESHASAYHVLQDSQFAARERVIASAAAGTVKIGGAA